MLKMGVIVQKMPGRQTGIVDRLAGLCGRFIQGFINFADVGFRYIDIPVEDGYNKPKKKR
jgi:hypothetical protein